MTFSARTALFAALALTIACTRPPDMPGLSVSIPFLTFDAPAGTGEPVAQVLYASNTGRGALDKPTTGIFYKDGADWLTATVSGAQAPFQVSVQPTVAGLASGTYEAVLTLTSTNAGGSPAQVSVKVTVPQPAYGLSALAVELQAPLGGLDPAPATIHVSNAGRGAIPAPMADVTYFVGDAWLTATVIESGDGYDVDVQGLVAGLDSGTYSATLTLSALAGPPSPVALAVTLTVPPAAIGLATHAVRIDAVPGGAPAPATVDVTNVGGGLLDLPTATVAAGAPWLTATVSYGAALYQMALQAATAGLASGTYTTTVEISTPDAATSETIAVTLVVPQPSLALSATAVAVQQYAGCPAPASTVVRIGNGGGGILPVPTATVAPAAAGWLSAAVDRTEAPYRLTLTMTGIPPVDPVTHAMTATVQVQAAGLAPAQLTFTYTELAPQASPATAAAPSPLDIRAQAGAGDPGPRRLSIRTAGACLATPAYAFGFTAGDPAWLGGTLSSAVQRHDLLIQASAAGMAAGDGRTATVHLSAPGYAEDVPVTLHVGAVTPTGALSLARPSGQALLALPDGRALLVGGTGGTGTAKPAEIWDPATGAWTQTGTMVHQRLNPGLAVLEDGSILVCGSPYIDPTDMTCERMVGTTWSLAGTMAKGRRNTTIVPLDGLRVLAVGTTSAATEIFDAGAGAGVAQATADGLAVRAGAAVRLDDGRVLAAGYWGSWTYDPAIDLWLRVGDMLHPSDAVSLKSLPDGRVLAIGGGIPTAPAAEIWDPVTGLWTATTPPTLFHLPNSVVGLSNRKVAAAFGQIVGTGYSPKVELFDPATETWSVVATFPAGRYNSAVTRLESGQILFAGGSTGTVASYLEAFTW
jgi:hypothetical protein